MERTSSSGEVTGRCCVVGFWGHMVPTCDVPEMGHVKGHGFKVHRYTLCQEFLLTKWGSESGNRNGKCMGKRFTDITLHLQNAGCLNCEDNYLLGVKLINIQDHVMCAE